VPLINPYQIWKDDKDSTPKHKKPKKVFKCRVCGKQVNGLKDHVKNAHGGQVAWLSYQDAEDKEKSRSDESFKADFHTGLVFAAIARRVAMRF